MIRILVASFLILIATAAHSQEHPHGAAPPVRYGLVNLFGGHRLLLAGDAQVVQKPPHAGSASTRTAGTTGTATARAGTARRTLGFQRVLEFRVLAVGQHVLHDLVYQRMIGNLNVSLDIFLTRGDIGKHRRQQIVRADALNLRRNLLPALKTKQC